MKYLDLTFPTPEANLACDEALLDWCEAGQQVEILRFWESKVPFVVLGYANQVAREANVAACRQLNVPILRRCTGGGTVVQGPGCLNYSLIRIIGDAGPLANIPGTNRCIMDTHRRVFETLLNADVQVQGHTDLAVNHRKFSGNAQRRKRRCLLFHGTFLLSFDLSLIGQLLPLPSTQPAYRSHRSHVEFLQNLPVSSAAIKAALRDTWHARDLLTEWPSTAIEQLVNEKYSRADWNLRF